MTAANWNTPLSLAIGFAVAGAALGGRSADRPRDVRGGPREYRVAGRLSRGRLGLTALIFGLAHLLNQHATLWGALAVAIAAGGMLGAAYVATRNLWVPIGMHFAWNFAEGGIFGTEISGNNTPQGLLDGVMSGPSLLTGGAFGPEGSVYSVGVGVVVTIGFLWLARRRGTVLAPRRRSTQAVTLVP